MATKDTTLRVNVVADTRKAGADVDSFGSKVGKLGGLAAGAGLAAAGGLALIGKAAFDQASDVQQALGAVETIFGKHADDVKASALAAADAVGLSQANYANLASLLGAQLSGMGTAADQLAPKTDQLIGLGADLAATFGGSVEEAVSAVSSLLKGERDPIERYGVSIKAADVEAKKAALGLTGLTGAAAKQADAQATLALLMDQTAKASGAFARESDTAAGAQQRFQAKLDNVLAKLGAAFLPIVTEAVSAMSGLLDGVDGVAGSLGEKLAPFLETVGAILTETVFPAFQAVGKFIFDQVLPVVGELVGLLAENLGPVFGLIAGFIVDTVVPALTSLWSWFAENILPTLRDNIVPVFASVKDALGKIFDAIGNVIEKLQPFFDLFGTVYAYLFDKVAPFLGGALKLAFDTIATAIGFVADSVGAVVDAFNAVWNAIGDAIQRMKEFIGLTEDTESYQQLFNVAPPEIGGSAHPWLTAAAARDLSPSALTAASSYRAGRAAGRPADQYLTVQVGDETLMRRVRLSQQRQQRVVSDAIRYARRPAA